MSERVLLIGATGFIGSHCLDKLIADGCEVHAISRVNQENRNGVIWHHGDILIDGTITEIIQKVKPSHLLNFGWEARPGIYWNSKDNLLWVSAGIEMLQAFLENGGSRIVMAGTCAEYSWSDGICSEYSTPKDPSTLYGECKNILQQVLQSYSKHCGISCAWGRIFYLFGDREHHARLVPSVTRSLLNNEIARCTDGKQIRDFLYVKDVAAAFCKLLFSELDGPINIASGKPTTVSEVVTTIARLLNRTELLRLGEIPTPISEPASIVADVTRLNKELCWRPNFELEAGIYHTINWWQKSK